MFCNVMAVQDAVAAATPEKAVTVHPPLDPPAVEDVFVVVVVLFVVDTLVVVELAFVVLDVFVLLVVDLVLLVLVLDVLVVELVDFVLEVGDPPEEGTH
jgi:hypothetical protein